MWLSGQDFVLMGGISARFGARSDQCPCHLAPCSIQRLTTSTSRAVRCLLWLGEDELIDVVERQGLRLDGRHLCALWREERPVSLPLGALLDPALDHLDLAGGEVLVVAR